MQGSNLILTISIICFLSLWALLDAKKQRHLIEVKTTKKVAEIKKFRFSSALKSKLRNKYSNLSDGQIELVFQGLQDYFVICCLANGGMVAMPSRIVDEAWHEFMLFSRDYAAFCNKVFGHFLHHNPVDKLTKTDDRLKAISLAWTLSCKMSNENPKNPITRPLLFRIDEELAIQDGIKYNNKFNASDYFDFENDMGNIDLPSCGA